MGCSLVDGYSGVTWCQVARATAPARLRLPAARRKDPGPGSGFQQQHDDDGPGSTPARLRLPAARRKDPGPGSGFQQQHDDDGPVSVLTPGKLFQIPFSTTTAARLRLRPGSGILPAFHGGTASGSGAFLLPALWRPSGGSGILPGLAAPVPAPASSFPGNCFKYHSAARRRPRIGSGPALASSSTAEGSWPRLRLPAAARRRRAENDGNFRKGFYIISITTR